MSRPNRQESSEQDQEMMAKEYLNLNKQREAIGVETTNLLKSLDSARDGQFLVGDLGGKQCRKF
ncbi:MAG: hypothetical protein KGH56_03240 [Patescibacteria group bacterium]|nr:hypothetical protein [Patescibacteria group bacterium]